MLFSAFSTEGACGIPSMVSQELKRIMSVATVYRKILTPESLRVVIDIPEEFRG